jgi:hypothetical protein
MRFLHYIFCALLLSAVLVSCQKEQSVNDVSSPEMQGANYKLLATLAVPGSVMAKSGTLTVTVKDSSYVFDAKKDSIAFVNLYLDNKRYFGITAINKTHNMSFGISSPGFMHTNVDHDIAGSQFILNSDKGAGVQYALTQVADMQRMSRINFSSYAQDSILVKGTFEVFLTPNPKSDSSFYRVKGQFDLKIK